MHKILALIITIFFSSSVAFAQTPNFITEKVPNAQVVGEGRLIVWLWKVYDATLYAPDGVWSQEKPFALRLRYLRDFTGEEISKRSLKEMRQQGYLNEVKLSRWYDQMVAVFPDVSAGDELTGVFVPNKATHFYDKTKLKGSIEDQEFGIQFFDIWLNEKTSEPKLRKKLMGLE